LARNVILTEARCIGDLAARIDDRFAMAAQAIFRCGGTVILTGIGKAGIIAGKISATLASTGTPSIFLHPVEALHGDLGRVRRDDVVVALSHSGATEEIVRLLDHLKSRGAVLIAITGRPDSPLAQYAETVLCYGDVEEACPLGLAPSASTSCMLALGDALALTVMDMRKFSPEEFAAFHPGGELGRKLLRVEELMTVRRERLPLAQDHLTVRQVLQEGEKLPRRPGALLLVDGQGRLTGILTDADLRRRLLSQADGNLLDRPVGEVMIRNPKCIQVGELASQALAILNKFRIDELPVVDADHRPVGMLDVQDLVGLKTVNHGQE
jgi:arabinose-5-phosphate isomerase